jgi:hypothetical protein
MVRKTPGQFAAAVCAAPMDAVTLVTSDLTEAAVASKTGRIDAEEDDQHDQRVDDHLLARRQVEQRFQAVLGQRAEDHPAVEPQRVGRRQDDAGGAKNATQVLTRKAPSMVRNSPTKPLTCPAGRHWPW